MHDVGMGVNRLVERFDALTGRGFIRVHVQGEIAEMDSVFPSYYFHFSAIS
jgi:hypothetical protein